jgi:hypothetical protein
MDGLQMLSARGPLQWEVVEGNVMTKLTLPMLPTVEVRGASFSAASRDPEQRRFADVGAYFRQGPRSEYPCSLCVRVTVRDQRTGKYGLLWDEGKETDRYFTDPTSFWEERLPEGAKAVCSPKSSMVGGRGEGLECWIDFYVCPETDQEYVPEEDRLYHVALGEDNSEGDDYPFGFVVMSTDAAKVGSVIRALC